MSHYKSPKLAKKGRNNPHSSSENKAFTEPAPSNAGEAVSEAYHEMTEALSTPEVMAEAVSEEVASSPAAEEAAKAAKEAVEAALATVEEAAEPVEEATEAAETVAAPVEEAAETALETVEEATEAAETVEEAVETASETVEEATEAAETVAETVEEAAETASETVEEATEAAETVAETAEEAADAASETVEEATKAAETAAETVEEVKEATETAAETVEEVKEAADAASETATDTVEETKEASEEATETAAEAVEEVKEAAEEVEVPDSVKDAIKAAIEEAKTAGEEESTNYIREIADAEPEVDPDPELPPEKEASILADADRALAGEQFSSARYTYQRLVDAHTHLSAAYLGRFLAERNCKDTDAFISGQAGLLENVQPKVIDLSVRDPKKSRFRDYVFKPYITMGMISEFLVRDVSFELYCPTYEKILKNTEFFFGNDSNWTKAKKYATPEELAHLTSVEETVVGRIKAIIEKTRPEDEAREQDAAGELYSTEAKLKALRDKAAEITEAFNANSARYEAEQLQMQEELNRASSQITDVRKEIAELKAVEIPSPELARKEELDTQIRIKRLEYETLPFFKGGEKKKLAAEIEKLQAEVKPINDNLEEITEKAKKHKQEELIRLRKIELDLSNCIDRNRTGIRESKLAQQADNSEEVLHDLYDRIARFFLPAVKVGGYVKFGTNYLADEDKRGPLEWLALAKVSGKLLLISRYVLDARMYHEWVEDITWEKCDLRKRLNKEFFEKAFNANEKRMIAETELPPQDNIENGVPGGNTTTDKVFLLSMEEAQKYFATDLDRISFATDQAVANHVYVSPTTNGSWWWLRTPGKTQSSAANINSDGSIGVNGDLVNHALAGIRPAIWVDLSVKFDD